MQNGRNDVQLVAGADLSSSRNLLVKLDGTIPADATEVAVGSIATPGGTGDRISVAYQGIATCVAGEALTHALTTPFPLCTHSMHIRAHTSHGASQDKACIDQSNIQQSLACLPVFLAGCQTLLVVAGPTYCSRLWCVMELFTFARSKRL